MRPLAIRRLTALAISAAISLGTAGPAFAGEHHPSPAADRAAHAPVPDTAALLAQAQSLGELGSVTTPVTELVTAALKADSGRLPAADVEAFKAKIAAAVEEAKATAAAPDGPAPQLPATPASPDLPVTAPVIPPAAELPVTPPAAELPVEPSAGLPVVAGAASAAGKAAPADVVSDALASVEKAVAGLLAAVTSGDAGGVVPQVTSTLTSLVNLAVSTVLGSGLPTPDLAGLPALPQLPVTPPELPVAAPELPVTPPLPAR
ncbi:hypothetical protein ABTX77_00730 [Streptomyces sp. NPDC097704]|uniref:hypothetical protein n=1 Tax=Streptomyces sp. NPDC097704 TaxID=3157101 RepID=UPI0033197D2B